LRISQNTSRQPPTRAKDNRSSKKEKNSDRTRTISLK
jgi:hypothetical protein